MAKLNFSITEEQKRDFNDEYFFYYILNNVIYFLVFYDIDIYYNK